jgi:hypothetical protein
MFPIAFVILPASATATTLLRGSLLATINPIQPPLQRARYVPASRGISAKSLASKPSNRLPTTFPPKHPFHATPAHRPKRCSPSSPNGYRASACRTNSSLPCRTNSRPGSHSSKHR